MNRYDKLTPDSNDNFYHNKSYQLYKSESGIVKKLSNKTLNIFISIVIVLLIILIYCLISNSSKLSQAKEQLLITQENLRQAQARENDNKVEISKLKQNKSKLEKDHKEISNSISVINKENDDFANTIRVKSDTRSSLNCQIRNIKEKTYEFEKQKELHYESGELLSDLISMKNEINNLKRKLEQKDLNFLLPSKILRFPQDLLFIKQALNYNAGVSLELLYRMSEDGSLPQRFHEKCDGIPNTLTIIKNSHLTIGGFTKEKWDGNEPKRDPFALLFNFKSEQAYSVINADNAIRPSPGDFPFFGTGDLYFEDKVCHTEFPSNYGINTSHLELTEGYSFFRYDEMEVFRIIFT